MPTAGHRSSPSTAPLTSSATQLARSSCTGALTIDHKYLICNWSWHRNKRVGIMMFTLWNERVGGSNVHPPPVPCHLCEQAQPCGRQDHQALPWSRPPGPDQKTNNSERKESNTQNRKSARFFWSLYMNGREVGLWIYDPTYRFFSAFPRVPSCAQRSLGGHQLLVESQNYGALKKGNKKTMKKMTAVTKAIADK